jgi:hypothetical protein
LATACPMIGAAGRRGTCADIAMERGSKTAVCVFMHTRPRGPAQWLSRAGVTRSEHGCFCGR